MQINTEYKQKALGVIQRFNDVRFAGQVLFVIIVLLISWSGIKTIQSNYELQKQISQLNQKNEINKLKNKNLELQNQYYKSKQYLELSARQNFGLANPGEKEVIVPASVALKNTVDLPTEKPEKISIEQPAYQRNLQAWVDFFLHRNSD